MAKKIETQTVSVELTEVSNAQRFANAAQSVAARIENLANCQRELAGVRKMAREAKAELKAARNEFADAQNALLGKPPRKPRKPRAKKADAAPVEAPANAEVSA